MAATQLAALLPLEPPPAPPLPWWDGLAPLALALLIALLLVAWWRHPAARRARRLRRLQRRLARPGSDCRALATSLEHLLRDATGQARLDAARCPTGLPPADWRALIDALQQARFDARPPAPADLAALLPAARRAIRRGDA